MSHCIDYFAVTGLMSFFWGRLIPPDTMRWGRFPYVPCPGERSGGRYKRIGIHHWQSKVPDMSRIFRKLIPPKRLVSTNSRSFLRMIQATCIAELVHAVLCHSGICLHLALARCGWLDDGCSELSDESALYSDPAVQPSSAGVAVSKTNRKGGRCMSPLILTCDTGEEHNSCAGAIKEVCGAEGMPSEIINALYDRSCFMKGKGALD